MERNHDRIVFGRLAGRRMRVKKVIVDTLPKDCMLCPLTNQYRKDCGKETGINYNGGARYEKRPDERCKLRVN